MPRFRRIVRPHTLVHVIVRFVNHERILDSNEARAEYLLRSGRYFAESDWRALSYGLMSTHVHFGAIAGTTPIAEITQPLHDSFVHWLKKRRRRLGPMVAGRPRTKELPLLAAPALIAYHHNNPVKAGLVTEAKESDWTSHGDYLEGGAPGWLHVELGLALAGLGTSDADRKRFDDYVNSRVGAEPPDEDESFDEARHAARVALGPSVELGSPRLSPAGELIADVFASEEAVVRPMWRGSLQALVKLVAARSGMSAEQMRSKSRVRAIAQARRLFVLCAHVELHRPIGEVAAAVCISGTSARELEVRATPGDRSWAAQLAEEIRKWALLER